MILSRSLLKIGQQFPYLCIHGISQYIYYKLLIHSYTGIHMMLFLLPESYFYILGILLTFDLFVPGDILGEVLFLISSNDSKQCILDILKTHTELIFIPWSHGGI